LSPDERLLAFVHVSAEGSRIETIDRVSRARSTLLPGEPGAADVLIPVGWQDNRTLVVIAQHSLPDWSFEADVLCVSPDTPPRRIVAVPGGLGAEARLDPAGHNVVLVVIDSDQRHNLVSVDLKDGSSRKLTRNQEAGVSIAGLRFLSDGSLIYSRLEHDENLWSLQFNPGGGAPVTE
ncbi:MAG TPA: hypothetical protein VGC81_05300, partial [Candidatus Methylomirabilis sp.]